MAGSIQRVSPNAVGALKDALTAAFWFKRDLYAYAKAAVSNEPLFLAGIDWTGEQYKRDSVSLFVDRLVGAQDTHPGLLIELMVDVAAMEDFPKLAIVEDADSKIAAARVETERLRGLVEPFERQLVEQEALRERIDVSARLAEQRRATAAQVAELKAEYMRVMALAPQPRGFALEKLLASVFDAFDLDPRSSFRVTGEQIDGGFTLEGEHFVLEAKWEKSPTARDDLDVFTAKVRRRSENTLGLFLAIAGFESTAVQLHSGTQSPIILMDGADLYAVLDDRIDLGALLRRKRRESSMTGNVFLPVSAVLTGA